MRVTAMSANVYRAISVAPQPTHPFMQEALEQALNVGDQVLANKAVIAPPSEGGQAPQEVTLRPGGRNREGRGQDH